VDDVAAQYGARAGGAPAPGELAPAPPFTSRLPVISWVTAGHWREAVDSFQPGDADAWVETTKRVGRSAFALRVRGDSMEPRCPDGAVIVVDPEREAVNGSLVVVRLDEDREATFKRLVIEGGRRFLAPLNPRYPVLEITGPATICGVVRQVLIDLD
jgi:SOS-response transcriptional repressor LexA